MKNIGIILLAIGTAFGYVILFNWDDTAIINGVIQEGVHVNDGSRQIYLITSGILAIIGVLFITRRKPA